MYHGTQIPRRWEGISSGGMRVLGSRFYGQKCLGNAHLNYFALFYRKASQKFIYAMLLGPSQESSNHIRIPAERIGYGALETYDPIERARAARSVKVPLDPRITKVGKAQRYHRNLQPWRWGSGEYQERTIKIFIYQCHICSCHLLEKQQIFSPFFSPFYFRSAPLPGSI